MTSSIAVSVQELVCDLDIADRHISHGQVYDLVLRNEGDGWRFYFPHWAQLYRFHDAAHPRSALFNL